MGSGLGRAIAHQSSTLADSEWEATRLRKASRGVARRDALVECSSPPADPLISCNLLRPRSVDLPLMAVNGESKSLVVLTGGERGGVGAGELRVGLLLLSAGSAGRKKVCAESIEDPELQKWHPWGSQEQCCPTRGASPRGRMNPTTLFFWLPLNPDNHTGSRGGGFDPAMELEKDGPPLGFPETTSVDNGPLEDLFNPRDDG